MFEHCLVVFLIAETIYLWNASSNNEQKVESSPETLSFQAQLIDDHCDQPFMLTNTTLYGSLGYDIVTGNPIEIGASVDPGFADPIFRMTLTA